MTKHLEKREKNGTQILIPLTQLKRTKLDFKKKTKTQSNKKVNQKQH